MRKRTAEKRNNRLRPAPCPSIGQSKLDMLTGVMTGIARGERAATEVSAEDMKKLVRDTLAFAADSRSHANILGMAYRNGRFPMEPLLSIAVEAASLWFEGLSTDFHAAMSSALSGCSNGDGMIPMLHEIFLSGRTAGGGRSAFFAEMRKKRFDEEKCFAVVRDISGSTISSVNVVASFTAACLCILRGESAPFASGECERAIPEDGAAAEKALADMTAPHFEEGVVRVLETDAEFPFLGAETRLRFGNAACVRGLAGRLLSSGAWRVDDVVKNWPSEPDERVRAFSNQMSSWESSNAEAFVDAFVDSLRNEPEKLREYAWFLDFPDIPEWMKKNAEAKLLPLREAEALARAMISYAEDLGYDAGTEPAL